MKISLEYEDLLDLCHEHLTGRGVILWSRAFDLNDPVSRLEAAKWLATEMAGVLAQ